MRAAVAHRHAKALGGTEDDIGTLFARCSQQNQRHEVRSDADHHFACFQLGDQLAVIMNFAGGPHLLQQHAENVLMVERFFRLINDDVKAKGCGTGAHHIQGLRMYIGGNEEAVRILQLADAFGHRHCFSAGGRLIQQ